MIQPCWNFSNLLFCIKCNFLWFETILKFRKSSSSKRTLTPCVNITIFKNRKSLIAPTCYLVNPPVAWNSFNQYRRVFEFNWFSNTKLSVLVRAHRVDEVRFCKIMSVKFQIFLTSYKSSMMKSTRNYSYRYIIRAESWYWVGVLHQ